MKAAQKKVAKKSAPKKKAKAVKKSIAAKPQKAVGVVTHFFTAIKVAIVKFKQPVKVGVVVAFRGATTDSKQKIVSMQFDHQPLSVAPKNKEVGIKVAKRVREGDEVFIVS